MSVQGRLFLYGKNDLCAIEVAPKQPLENGKTVVFIGGLSDGLLTPKYVSSLANAVSERGHRFVQPVLRSSYAGYGNSNVQQDAEDLLELLDAINRAEPKEVVLMGHSTGCQDIMTLLGKSEASKFKITGAILQGAVSDREAFDAAVEANPALGGLREELATIATHMQPLEFLPRKASELVGRPQGDPMTAQRFLSLNGKQTEEDLFSSDLSDEYLKRRLGHVQCPVLLLLSEKDEFYPRGLNVKNVGEKLARGFGGDVTLEIITSAGHFLESHHSDLEDIVIRFLLKLA